MIPSNTGKKKHMFLQTGIGLIELLVSMLIGLFIMGGVLQLFSTSSQNAVAVAGSSRIQENVRFAFARIADDIAQSGNLGCISASVADAAYSTKSPIVSQINSFSGTAFDFLGPVRIKHATSAGTTAAPTNGQAPGTDSFSISYVNNTVREDVMAINTNDVSVIDASDISIGDIVAVSNCFQGAIFTVTDISGNTISHANGFEKNISSFIPNTANSAVSVVSPFYLYGGTTGAYEYSIGQSVGATGNCMSGADPEIANVAQANCSLFREDISGRQELVQGVHGLTVLYGWTDNAGNLRLSASPTPTQAKLIDRMRVEMVFNSIDSVNTVGNNIDQTANGLILKTYARTFNLFNRVQ